MMGCAVSTHRAENALVEHLADLLELVCDFPASFSPALVFNREVRTPHFDPVVRRIRRYRSQDEQAS